MKTIATLFSITPLKKRNIFFLWVMLSGNKFIPKGKKGDDYTGKCVQKYFKTSIQEVLNAY